MISWKRNLYVIWVCQFIAMIGMSAIIPFLPLFVRELGVKSLEATANWSGLVFSAPFFLSFFLAPVWGSMGDRYGRKIMILRAIFGLAIAQIIVGFSQDLTQLFLGRMLQGALSGFLPASMALVASNTPEEKTGYALGLLQSSTAAGNIFGPFVGGVLSDLFGFRLVFFAVAGLLTFTGFLLLYFVKEEVQIRSKEDNHYTFRENWMYLIRTSSLFWPSVMITLAALSFSFIRPIFVLYVETMNINKQLLPTITGSLYSVIGIFSTISSAWWGKRVENTGIKKNVLYASIITAGMYSLYPFIYDPILFIPVGMILGFGYGAILPLLFTAISTQVPQQRKGGVLGIGSSFQILGNMTGPLLGGLSVSLFGLRFSFIITAAFFLIITALSLIKLKN